jgi:5-methylthioadenosine/S-adenosylhomocysteine deaminase
MENVDLLIEPRWVAPVVPRAAVLEHHAVAVRDGCIVGLLPVDQAAQRFAAGQRVTLPTHLLIPGLINLHTHAAMTLFRGIGDDLPLMQWLETRIWPLERALVSPEFVRASQPSRCSVRARRAARTCTSIRKQRSRPFAASACER